MRNLLTLTPIAAAGSILRKTCAFSLGGASAVLAFFCFSASLHAQNTASVVGRCMTRAELPLWAQPLPSTTWIVGLAEQV